MTSHTKVLKFSQEGAEIHGKSDACKPKQNQQGENA